MTALAQPGALSAEPAGPCIASGSVLIMQLLALSEGSLA